ncbi:MAG: 23S rRNA (adenine(2030)-N(6))-methyltransferase RlmJ [Gammaproteobacteria bacterium]
MNYRHAYHAGNFADVMKHSVLVLLLDALKRKTAPWCYFDTHAGAGIYDLKSEAAARTGEAAGGIGRLWPARSAAPAAVAQLCEVITGINDGSIAGTCPRRYPGSPAVAASLARAQDRLVLAELHPQEERLLREHFRSDPRVSVHGRDGYEMLTALAPPAERRGLVLMDPPFEKPDEFVQMPAALKNAYGHWPTGIYALWYPLKEATVVKRFERALAQSGIRRILLAESRIAAAGNPGFYGCGMALVNPPWQSEQKIGSTLNFLKTILAPDIGSYAVRWLVRE